MITRPKLDKTINNAEDLINQNDMKWGIGEGYGVEEAMRQAQIGSTPRSLIDQGDHELGKGINITECQNFNIFQPWESFTYDICTH